jgi:hypothetical protein
MLSKAAVVNSMYDAVPGLRTARTVDYELALVAATLVAHCCYARRAATLLHHRRQVTL